MDLKTLIIGYLPTKWSQAIMGSPIAIAIAEMSLSKILPLSVVPIWSKAELLLLTILILSTLLIGTTLLLTVVAYHKKIKEFITTQNDKAKEKVIEAVEKQADKILESTLKHKPLDDIAVNILLRLWKFPEGLTDKAIAKMLEVDIQTIKYHLEKLEPQKMVHGTLAVGQPRIWRLIQGGRTYLIENKLISEQ